MKNTSKKLLFKHTIVGFLVGAAPMLPQLFILSGYVSQQKLAQLLVSKYSLLFFSIIPIVFAITGFLIARSKIIKLRLNKQLQTSEDEIQVLQLELSDYQYALELCAITTIIDGLGKIKKVNNNFLSFTDCKAEDMLGKSIWQIPSSFQKPGIFVDIQETVNAGNVWRGEIEYYQPGGTISYTKATIVPLLQQGCEQSDCMVIQFDITQEKNIDLALRKSEKVKSIILENTQTLICTHDLKGNIININKAGANLLGSPVNEIIGKPLQSFIDNKYSTDEYLSDINENGVSAGYMKVLSKDNKKKTLLYKNVICTEQGETYIIASAIDVTETLEAQKTIDNQKAFTSRMVDESPNMIFVIDEDKKITFLNKKLRSFFNIMESEKIVTLDDAQNSITDFSSLTGILDEATKHSVHECKIVEPGTGILKWFKVQKTYFTDNDRKKFMLIIATDISEKHAIQVELIRARQTVETSLRMRENFIANMSHEIRTPLNAIIGFSELLDDTLLDDTQDDYLKTIKVAGQNLLNIINDILDLSKLESGNMEISKANIDILAVVNNVKKLFEPKIREKNIELTLEFANNIPAELLGDEMKLNQILINLVSNAIKFTDSGKVEILVKAESFTNEKCNVQFIIKDTGIGIDSDKLDVIFQRYSQASKDIHKLYGGTGLGLSICKSLIQLLGGSIKLSSEKGIGTIFSFSLPFEIFENKVENKLQINTQKILDVTPLRVLIAEDNNTNAKLAIQVLKKYNYYVCRVKDGSEVLDILEKDTFDIILMDVQMAQLDGIETSKIIRLSGKKYCNIPIIALTAHSFKGERNICVESGMNSYLGKPYKPEELLSSISKTLASVRKEPMSILLQIAS